MGLGAACPNPQMEASRITRIDVYRLFVENPNGEQDLVTADAYIDLPAHPYTEALLSAARTRVYAIDRDPDAIAHGEAMAARHEGRLVMVAGRFGDMDQLLAARGATPVDGVTLDVGVSSPQLDDASRGFSFRADGPLDMRMEKSGASAADLVNDASEQIGRAHV